ncbi:MAG: ribonuclease J [Deltaproteobacteria bacterium]
MAAPKAGGREVITPSGAEVVVVPLGGCGEVGLNATLVLDGQHALLIDCGALLGVENAPGVEKAVPGFEALFAEGRRLEGVVLTHGHEDHIGGLPSLLAQLDVPVFGTPLTIALARSRLENVEGRASANLTEVVLGSRITIGPFTIELVRVTHSLPDSAALAIDTRAGRILHSGDFKLDPMPAYGPPTDTDRLKALGEEGVALLLADSTNSEVEGHARSESEVALEIDRLIGSASQRVVVSLFASHLHRVRAVVDAAKKHGRRVALLGRSLERTWKIGVAQKQLPNDPTFLIAPEHLARVEKKRVVILATGSQGEWQGGLAKLALAKHANLRLVAGDRVILSTRAIPGNERAVGRLRNHLLRMGVEVFHDRMAPVHCSGHAHAGEQRELMNLVRPASFVPIHGERAMLEAHARTARGQGVEQTLIVEDGQSVVLSGGKIARGRDEPVSRCALDSMGRPLDWKHVTERNRIGRGGLIVVSLAVDPSGRPVGQVAITARGRALSLAAERQMRQRIAEIFEENPRLEVEPLTNKLRSQISAISRANGGIRAEVEVHVVRLTPPIIG